MYLNFFRQEEKEFDLIAMRLVGNFFTVQCVVFNQLDEVRRLPGNYWSEGREGGLMVISTFAYHFSERRFVVQITDEYKLRFCMLIFRIMLLIKNVTIPL